MGNLCGSQSQPIHVQYSLKGTKSEGSQPLGPLPTIDKTNGIIRTERKHAPAHFVWKIESYSKLLESGWGKIESGSFEVDGRKWKLTFYPNGDHDREGSGYISLYLSLLDTEELPISWDLFVKFQFFVFDQLNDKYLVIQDVNEVCRFQRMRTEWGFAKSLPLDVFKDPSNGYLLNDCCVFGVDAFVIKAATRGESFSIVKPLTSGNSYIFKIENFSTIDKEYVESEVFTIQGVEWKLRLYHRDTNDNVSLYLFLGSNLQDCNSKVYATCDVHMICNELIVRQFAEKLCHHAFSYEHGFRVFSTPASQVNGYLANDELVLAVKFLYLSNVKSFS